MQSSFRRSMGLALASFCIACGSDPQPAQPTGPNVLLVTLDTTRADRLGCYGHAAAKTPNIDRLARSGVRFAHAVAPVPLTLPAHATLLSGLHPSAHGVHVNKMGRVHSDVRTLAEEFQDRGYRTGAFVGSIVLHEQFGLARGFDAYDDVEDTYRPGSTVVDAALAWLAGDDKPPFFAWVHLFDAHDPYQPPPGFRNGFEHPYDGEIAFVDAQIGRLLGWLDGRGLEAETIVVIAGDHGESLGEHDEDTHGVFLYDSTMHVPLIMRGPGFRAGTVVEPVVGLIDVAPTLYELFDWPAPTALEGRSLAPALLGQELDAHPIFIESEQALAFGWAPLAGVVTDEWKFIAAPRPELYRLGAEEVNLIEDYPDVVERLGKVLAGHQGRAVVREAGTVTLSASDAASMRALGYIGEEESVEHRAGRAALLATHERGELDDAKDHMQDLREMLVQQSIENWMTLAQSMLASGRFADAIAAVWQHDRLGERTPASLCVVGDAQQGLGDLGKAKLAYQGALGLQPDRGQTHNRLGKLLAHMGDIGQAIVHFEAYVESDSQSARAHTNLANALFTKLRSDFNAGTGSFRVEDLEPGLAHLHSALRLEPDFVPAHIALVTVYTNSGRPREALQAMRAGAQAAPDDPQLTSGLAWRLATAPDARAQDAAEALKCARAAVTARPRSAINHDILAAAYAHAGDFPNALKSAQRALVMARAEPNAALSSAIEARLALYRSGRAFRNQ